MSYNNSLLHAPDAVRIISINGSSPWRVFDRVWTAASGYPANGLDITPGVTPMLSIKATAAALVTYYTVIFTGRELMRNRPAFKLNELFLIHNLYLTIISGVLLVLFIEQLAPTIWRHGLFFTICDAGGWNKSLETLYYLNYLTKYLELLDTLFLVLKKKPLTFLHTYHHGATAFLCYTQLIGHTSVSWVPITLNLTVHVVMYWYYFQAARGVRIWWKEWITRLQIGQFVLDLAAIYFATYNYVASAHLPHLPHVGACAGEGVAAFVGCATLTSYLFLFIAFYASTYKKASSRKKRSLGAVTTDMPRTAALDMKNTTVPTASETSEVATEALHAVEGAMKVAGAQIAHDFHFPVGAGRRQA